MRRWAAAPCLRFDQAPLGPSLEDNFPAATRFREAELSLRSGTDDYLVHINIGRLLDRERNSAGDRIRRQRELVSGVGELGFHRSEERRVGKGGWVRRP